MNIKDTFKKNYAVSSIMIYLLGSILLQGLSFITTPIFTRVLLPDQYGITTVFTTWVNFFMVFIGLQVSGSIVSAIAHKNSDELSSYMKSIVILSVLGAIIISTVCFIIREKLSVLLQIDKKLIHHLLIQSFGSSCSTLYSLYTIYTKQPKKNVIFSVIYASSNIILSLCLVLSISHDKYMGKIYSGTLINILVIIYVISKFTYRNKSKINIFDWKYSLSLGLPLIIHLLSNIIIGQSNKIFLTNALGFDAAAKFSVSHSIASIGLLCVEVTHRVWAPWYFDNTKEENNDRINDITKKYIMLVCGIFILVMLISPEIIRIMAPEEYWNSTSSLIIITTSVFFQFLYRFPLAYEQYSGNMKWVAFCTISSALVNMGINYVLIDKIGIMGAAISLLISYIILFIMHEFVARRIIKGFNIRIMIYMPSIFMIVILSFISCNIIDYWYIRYSIIIIAALFFIMRFKSKRSIWRV